MKEKDFFDERVAFEDKLVEAIRPGVRRCVTQNTGEWQFLSTGYDHELELVQYLRGSP